MKGALIAVAATVLVLDGAVLADVPRFADEAAAAGIDHRYTGGWEHYVGGGVAAFDCDADGLTDLYFTGGSSPAGLYRNRSATGGPLRFEHVPAAETDLVGTTGAWPLDVDGDRTPDLVVTRVGENVLLKGLGDCRFERANEPWGVDGGNAWTTAFSAIWEAGNDRPTLAFGNYVDRDQPGAPFGTCHRNELFRPGPDGRYGQAEEIRGHCTLSMLFSDWNRDGEPDLRVSNDRQYYRAGEEQLFRLPQGEPASEFGQRDGWKQLKIWGMGIASHDLNGDGFPEFFLTSMADNKLQRLVDGAGREGKPIYDDIAFEQGVTAHRPFLGDGALPSTAWHAEFGDVNADGAIDLFVAKGNVEGMIDFAAKDPNNLLIGKHTGGFAEGAVEAGVASVAKSRGGALVDLNLDGALDLVVVNRDLPVELHRNLGVGDAHAPGGNWLMIQLDQPGGNRWGVGSWIEVKAGSRVFRKELSVGGGHAGGQLGWTHFGIGTHERALVRVQWPDGRWGPWVRTPSNMFLKVDRDAERPTFWQALPPTAADQ